MQQSRFSKVTAQILVIGISLAFIINFGPQAGTACAPQTGPAATADGLKISAGEYNRFTGNASSKSGASVRASMRRKPRRRGSHRGSLKSLSISV